MTTAANKKLVQQIEDSANCGGARSSTTLPTTPAGSSPASIPGRMNTRGGARRSWAA